MTLTNPNFPYFEILRTFFSKIRNKSVNQHKCQTLNSKNENLSFAVFFYFFRKFLSFDCGRSICTSYAPDCGQYRGSRALAILPIPLSATGNTCDREETRGQRLGEVTREKARATYKNWGSTDKEQGNAFVKP